MVWIPKEPKYKPKPPNPHNTPTNTPTDLINRQAAIRWVKTECNPYGKPTLDFESGKKIIEHLDQMSSADAVEVVRCKDCKWHLNGHLCKQLSQYGSIETPPSFYCGFGERREP